MLVTNHILPIASRQVPWTKDLSINILEERRPQWGKFNNITIVNLLYVNTLVYRVSLTVVE